MHVIIDKEPSRNRLKKEIIEMHDPNTHNNYPNPGEWASS